MAEFNSDNPFVCVWEIKTFSLLSSQINEVIETEVMRIKNGLFFSIRLVPKLDSPCSLSIKFSVENVKDINYAFEVICYNDTIYRSDNLTHQIQAGYGQTFSQEWLGIESYENILKNSCKFLKMDCLTIKVYLWLPSLNGVKFQEMRCCTKLETVEECTLDWKIQNLNSSDVLTKSVGFESNIYYEIKLMHIKNEGMKVIIVTSGSQKIVKIKIFLSDGSKYGKLFKLQDCRFDKTNIVWELPAVLTENECHMDIICLEIRLYHLSLVNSPSIKKTQYQQCKYVNYFTSTSEKHDFQHMYKNSKMADIELLAGGKHLFAHKFILASKSPVFSAMFEQEMAEKKNNIIYIEDMSYNTLNIFLLYLYGAKLQDLNFETAVELMNAAEKYQVLSLKEECAHFLISCLSLKNYGDIMKILKTVKMENLKLNVLNFIKARHYWILSSDVWGEFSKSNPELAVEVLTELVMHLSR